MSTSSSKSTHQPGQAPFGSHDTNVTTRLTEYVVTTRNTSVTASIAALYGPRVAGGVRVFCTSNKMYWDHRYKPRDEALPHLQLSGIIAVRRHCLSLVVESQLRITTNYIQNDIPALLEDVGLWVESGAGTMDAERKRIVRQALDAMEDRLRRVTSTIP